VPIQSPATFSLFAKEHRDESTWPLSQLDFASLRTWSRSEQTVKGVSKVLVRIAAVTRRSDQYFEYARWNDDSTFQESDFDKLIREIPTERIQRQIGDFYFDVSSKIEVNRRMNETLEAMARALFKSWFVDFDPVRAKAEGRTPTGMDAETAKLFPSEFEASELGRIPRGWGPARLGDLLELKRGYDLPNTQRRPGKVPIVSSSGATGTHDEAKARAPGVVTGRYGTIVLGVLRARRLLAIEHHSVHSGFQGHRDPLRLPSVEPDRLSEVLRQGRCPRRQQKSSS
jgi:hypothetical protein